MTMMVVTLLKVARAMMVMLTASPAYNGKVNTIMIQMRMTALWLLTMTMVTTTLTILLVRMRMIHGEQIVDTNANGTNTKGTYI